MRISVWVVICVVGAFLRPGNICAATTVRLSASAHLDGWLGSWEAQGSSSHVWVIRAPAGDRVLLSVDQLRVHSFSYSCENYLEVRDGETSWDRLLTKQCTTSTPPSPIYSSGNYLYVKFYTSNAYYNYGVSANFRALPTSSVECPKILLGNNTGVIYSPGFPNDYQDNKGCDWPITAPLFHFLLLNFTEVQMANCYDQVIVRDGQYSWSKQIASYCGSWYSSAVVVPSGRYARVEFTSKSYYSAKGFLLSIRFTDFRYQTTAAPYTQWPTTPYRWWTTEWVWRSTPHLDFKQRTRAIAVPLAVGFVLALVIIAVVVCEQRKRNPTPPPSGLAPRVVELQTFPLQVPVPTPHPNQTFAHPANNPPQLPDESRAALAGQPGGELPPENNPDWVTFSDQSPTDSRDPGASQPQETPGENFYAPSPV